MNPQTRESSELSLFVISENQTVLSSDETLEDLQREGLKLIQLRDGFRLCEDTVLLAAFAAGLHLKHQKPLKVADLGAGNGALSLLLASRLPRAHVTGVEISPRPYEVFNRNITLNRLEDRITAVRGDVRQTDLFARASFDLIVSNPPYKDPARHLQRPATGIPDLDIEIAQAYDMTSLSSNQLMQSAAAWLKPGGTLVLVQRPENLPVLLSEMQKARIEPTRLRAIVPLPGKKPSALLLAGRLHGKTGSFRFEPDLLVCDQPGHYTPEVAAIYGTE